MSLKETARPTYMDVSKTDWEPTRFPGVWMKKLYEEPSGRMTTLTKMEPGARLPGHRHVGIEQSFVLEGTLVDDDGACTAGNYVWRRGARSTRRGAPTAASSSASSTSRTSS